MDFNLKKGFAFSVLLLFAFSFFVPFVMAQVGGGSGGTPSGAANAVLGPIGDMFANWGEGNLSVNIAKYLLWAVLALLLFSVLENIRALRGETKDFIRWVIAIIVSFLAIAYVTPQEIYALMVSYTAMGFVLGGFLPILILMYFTWKLASHTKSAAEFVAMKVVTWFMWLGYTMFSVLKILYPPTNLGVTVAPSDVWVSWIFVAVGFIMLFINGPIWRWFGKSMTTQELQNYRDMRRKSRVSNEEAAEDVDAAERKARGEAEMRGR